MLFRSLTPGMTYSIGFRAPKTQEIASKFLEYLQDELCLDGMYADPDATVTDVPAKIDAQFVSRISQMLQQITWDEKNVTEFIGRYFSEPKPHVFFDQSDELLDYDDFAAAVAQHGVILNLKSQMLYSNDSLYLNGEILECEATSQVALQKLANTRQLDAGDYDDSLLETLFTYYEYGYLTLNAA